GAPARIGWKKDMAEGLAIVRGRQGIKSGVGAEMIRAMLDQRYWRNELIPVMQGTRVEHDRAIRDVVAHCPGDLATSVGWKARIAYSFGVAIEAPDAAVPA